jgi:probable F420-dependent oxidoreductase
MTDADITRRALGPVGAILGVLPTAAPAAAEQLERVRQLEAAGWPALWTNEVIGADALVRAATWLAATERLVVGTSIATVWARPAATAHAAASQLVQAHPGRFVLGLGIGRPEQAAAVGREFGPPVATMRAYLDALADREYPLLVGANGAKLLALAADRADGALPAGVPPETTATVRAGLGPDKLLAVYLPVSLGADGADVATAVAAHRAAGADHVIVGLSYDTPFAAAADTLVGLAPALI